MTWFTRAPRRLSAVFLSLLLAVLLSTPAYAAVAQKNVLVLYAAGRLLPANVEFDHALRQTLADSKVPVRIFDEFLDVDRFPANAQSQIVANYLRDKYANHSIDVIVVAGDEALGFVLATRQAIFAQTPVVFAGVGEFFLQSLGKLPPDVLGTAAGYDFAATIRQALRWHPQTHRLVLITGTSARDKFWGARLREIAPEFQGWVSVEFLEGLPTAELKEVLRGLSSDSLVFSPGYFRDGDGLDFLPRDTSRLIADAAPVPFYGPFPTHLGTGIVGGYMLPWSGMGEQAGGIVIRLLGGTSPSAIRLPKKQAPILHVDWNQARRWGIDEQMLPVGTVVHFREPTLLQAYGKVILGVLLVVLAQAGLIGWLLFERRRRRLAEQAIHEQSFELAHASRLAIAGQLTGSIAHEINQPLAAILSNAETADLLLAAEGNHREELRHILADIRRDDLRASQVIKRLRALLDKQQQEREPVDLNELMNDVGALLRTEAQRRKVVLAWEHVAEPLWVLADRIQLQQVMINLIFNAMDAVAESPEDRRTITVEVSREAAHASISVHDQGHGIAAEHLPLVFDSFFTRKPEGMGLGLSIVRSIVEAHGGNIRAQSTFGTSTVFRVDLPQATLRKEVE